jgi:hypothetical protein
MNGVKLLVFAIVGIVIYVSTFAAIFFLPQLYEGFVKNPNDPKTQEMVGKLEEFSKHPIVQNGFATFLTLIGLVVTQVVTQKQSDPKLNEIVRDETDRFSTPSRFTKSQSDYVKEVVQTFDRVSNDELKQQLQRAASNLYKTKRFARGQFRRATIFLVVVCVAFSNVIANGVESIVQGGFNWQNLSEPFRFIVLFSRSLTLAFFAFVISFYFYRRYYRLVGAADLFSIFRIGFWGVFAAGLLLFIQLSPEIFPVVAQNVGRVPYFNVSFITYAFVTRLLIFPSIGFVGSFAAGLLKRPTVT